MQLLILDLTPNRGDCFSVLGIARDVSALTGAPLKDAAVDACRCDDQGYTRRRTGRTGRLPAICRAVIRGIDPHARSPVWMTERLRRAGLQTYFTGRRHNQLS